MGLHAAAGAGSRLERFITGLFGSSNARYLRRLDPKIEAINSLEARFQALTDEQLRAQTAEFRRRLAAGETLDDILRRGLRRRAAKAGRRVLGMRHLRRAADRRHGAARRRHRRDDAPAKARRSSPRSRPT